MLMFKKFFLIFLSAFSNYFVLMQNKNNIAFLNENTYVEEYKELMKIIIPKANVDNVIYDYNSPLNNIDLNVSIMKESDLPDLKNGNVIIGAHSGYGPLAYFKKLNLIEIGDYVKIIYNDTIYNYRVVNKYLDEKDGSIYIRRNYNTNTLTLYTCNPNDKENFLVVICELE